MSTFGHLAVGAVAGRSSGPGDSRRLGWWMAWLAFVAIAADLDFIGVWFFGVGPGSTWNHRGASHSMIMSLASGIVSMFVARRVGVAPLQGGAIGTLVGATHPLLDGFNLESAGSLLWWPFSQAYWQARCRFLPGVLNTSDYLTAHGVRMLALELIGSAPFFWIAFRRGKERGRERGTGNCKQPYALVPLPYSLFPVP